MAVFKCKMCGGALEINGETVATCEYCGTTQTLPKTSDEVRENLFNRANNLRLKSEFDKAEQVYEKILEIDNSEAEAHWGIVLCKYGIEYVEDPKSFKRIPTCHRTSYEAITANADYLAAIENADQVQRSVYEDEARSIDAIQKNILSIVKNEEPFDVFICYKETDSAGKRTIDSAIANDIYHQLTAEGFKVFYAAITLESKLGQEYEPYIFSALNSAKVMLVIGTKAEYFEAVWVKNEWSRYMKLMAEDRSRLLIPCYREMDAYDLPEEFAHFQAQDMGKIGFINDVVRGIKKVISKNSGADSVQMPQSVPSSGGSNTAPLLERAFMFLEDGEWDSANEYCEKVLDIDPKCSEAYLGKLMAELRVRTRENLKNCAQPFDSSNNYQKAMRFGGEELAKELSDCTAYINERNENERLEGIYSQAVNAKSSAKTEGDYKDAARKFSSVSHYKDSQKLAEECLEKAGAARKDAILTDAKSKMSKNKIAIIEDAVKLFETISGWKDADEQLENAKKKLADIKAADEKARKEAEKRAKRNKKIAAIVTPIACVAVVFIIVLNTVIIPNSKYNKAVELMNSGKYLDATEILIELGDYKEGMALIKKSKDEIHSVATELMNSGKYSEAKEFFVILSNYEDCADKIQICDYMIQGEYKKAIEAGLTHFIFPDGVTSIGEDAFRNCISLTSIEIPDSVTSIGERAFYNCSSLTSIKIPDSVTSIGDSAFEYCRSLTSIEIPDSVTSIAGSAFEGCSSLTSIKIPDSVTSIGYEAFHGCSSLTSIKIPDSVTSIGYEAFHGCSSLESITIPGSISKIPNSSSDFKAYGVFTNCTSLKTVIIENGVESIGTYAFYGCSSLTSVEIPDSVKRIGGEAFYGCSSLTSVAIPDSMTGIGDSVFEGCSSLTSVEIPDSVKNIGSRTFYGCSSLANIKIPDGVKRIDYGTFYGCSKLTSVEIPDSVTSIGDDAFQNCSSLTSVEIPDSVTSIGYYAFDGCSSLTSVYYGGNAAKWSAISFGHGVWYNTPSSRKVYYSSTMPTGN